MRRGRNADVEDDALEKLKRLLQQDPGSLQFVQLAELYRQRGMLDEAIAVCQHGLANHPNYVSGLVALGRSYQVSGRIPDAVATFELVVELAPNNLVGHIRLGELYEQTGRLDEAGAHLAAAQQLGAETTDLEKRLDRRNQTVEEGDGDASGLNSAKKGYVSTSSDGRRDLLRLKIAALESYRSRFRQAGA